MCCGVLRCVAVWCSVCCSVLQCVAVCCSVLQCVAVCCSVLQFAVCCSAPIETRDACDCGGRKYFAHTPPHTHTHTQTYAHTYAYAHTKQHTFTNTHKHMYTSISPQQSTQRGQVDTYPNLVNKTVCRHTHPYTRTHTQIHTHAHIYERASLHTNMCANTPTFPSPHSTHRGRRDTYCKLVKLLKTPSGTLVSWLSDRYRTLWA